MQDHDIFRVCCLQPASTAMFGACPTQPCKDVSCAFRQMAEELWESYSIEDLEEAQRRANKAGIRR